MFERTPAEPFRAWMARGRRSATSLPAKTLAYPRYGVFTYFLGDGGGIRLELTWTIELKPLDFPAVVPKGIVLEYRDMRMAADG